MLTKKAILLDTNHFLLYCIKHFTQYEKMNGYILNKCIFKGKDFKSNKINDAIQTKPSKCEIEDFRFTLKTEKKVNMKLNKTQWSEIEIQNKLIHSFMSKSNIKYVCENLFIYEWESDLWFLTKSNITYEIEIKITKADFKNDFKKTKHSILTEGKKLDKKGKPCLLPNYFYYAVPENMIEKSDIPSYAGLIYMTEIFPYFVIVKQAPSLTKKKTTEEELNLTEKFYYNYRNYKLKTSVEKSHVDELNNLIDKFNEKPEGEKKTYVKLLDENKKYKEDVDYWKECYNKYYDKYQNLLYYNDLKRHIIRELRNLLNKNHIDYDYDKMVEEYEKNLKN